MRRAVLIVFLLLSIVARAATMTATVETYNQASLSGNVPKDVAVSFANSNESKGKVTQGATAVMTITGWPKATINAITLYLSSNKTSGAGTVSVRLNKQSWQVASGNYKDWPGMSGYSTTPQTLSCLSTSASMAAGASLSVEIRGTTNSINWTQMVVDYTEAPPQPHTVTLQWPSPEGVQYTAIDETVAKEGIVLPSVDEQDSVLTHGSKTWYWVGWTESSMETTTSVPLYWQRDERYYPEKDITLYALYTDTPQQALRQDSSFTTDEYAMMIVLNHQPMALSGGWNSGKITLSAVDMIQDNDQWTWILTELDDKYRYELEFTNDSVTIYHPLTKTWIGRSKSAGSNLRSQWAWQRAMDGSIYFYAAQQKKASGIEYSCLTINYDPAEDIFYATYATEPLIDTFPYWRLFPISAVPSPSAILFSTLPTMTDQQRLEEDKKTSAVTKAMDQQGRLFIQRNQQKFTILGQAL